MIEHSKIESIGEAAKCIKNNCDALLFLSSIRQGEDEEDLVISHFCEHRKLGETIIPHELHAKIVSILQTYHETQLENKLKEMLHD